MGDRLRILQINTSDQGGGAEKVAYDLWQSYAKRGHVSHLVVGRRVHDLPGILRIPVDEGRNAWARCFWFLSTYLREKGRSKLARVAGWVAKVGELKRWWDVRRGLEDFCFPGSSTIPELLSEPPDLIHVHNLHGDYFDLRSLAALSRQVPLFVSLHDQWLLTGHCSYSFDCERWRHGCGQCPDLGIYPAIRRDATAENWERKRAIYERCRLYVGAPSQWLVDMVHTSPLGVGTVSSRVIPNGIDVSIFRPAADRQAIRKELGIKNSSFVLMFAANKGRKNRFKDFDTIRSAVQRIAGGTAREMVLIALGEEGPAEQIGHAEARFVPYQKSPEALARYYQVADLFLHAAHADNFPTTILEAMACGTPVVATAVGGVSEQIKSLRVDADSLGRDLEGEGTGCLVPKGDAEGMAKWIERIMASECLQRQMRENAAKDARERFGLDRQVDRYLEWYREVLSVSRGRNVALESEQSKEVN